MHHTIADHYAGASTNTTGNSNGLYAKPLGDEAAPPIPPLAPTSRLIFCHNGSDSDQWPPTAAIATSDDLQSGYSAVYVAASNNGLAESSFSTSSTSDQVRSASSRGHSSISSK